jgi:hypothetical protein
MARPMVIIAFKTRTTFLIILLARGGVGRAITLTEINTCQ